MLEDRKEQPLILCAEQTVLLCRALSVCTQMRGRTGSRQDSACACTSTQACQWVCNRCSFHSCKAIGTSNQIRLVAFTLAGPEAMRTSHTAKLVRFLIIAAHPRRSSATVSSGPTAESNSCAAGEAHILVFHLVPPPRQQGEFSSFTMSPFVAFGLHFQAGRRIFQRAEYQANQNRSL